MADWWSTSFQLVQKHAQEAAEQARVLAQHASVRAAEVAQQASVKAAEVSTKAAEVAQQATVKATQVARQASEQVKTLAHVTAEEAQSKFRQLSVSDNSKKAPPLDHDAELSKYGLGQELVGFLRSLTYSTFSDFPVDTLLTSEQASSASPESGPSYKLSPWQERHACLALEEVQQLHDLRFVLCPRRMEEDMFWLIYFALVKRYLPTEALEAQASASDASAAKAAGQSTASKEVTLNSTTQGKQDHESDTSVALVDDDQLDELENDPELAAYLTEALADTNPDMESDAEGGEEDLDDYINQLDEEAKANKS